MPYRGDPEKARATRRRYYKRNTAKARASVVNSTRKAKYGIDTAGFNALVSAQGGRCAICKQLLLSGKRTHIDHDHETGQVRGVLCHSCNVGLGHFKDSYSLLCDAAIYLMKGGSE